MTLAEVTPFEQAPSSRHVSILPLNDNDSVPLPPINGNGEASDGLVAHAAIQFTKGVITSPSSVVPDTAEEAALASLESAVPQSNHSPQTTRVNAPPIAVFEPTTKPPAVDLLETAAPASNDRASTPASSTLTPKKRRSLFARIKHVFDKNRDKQERKEKNKH